MECELGGGKLSCLCAEQRPIPPTQNNRLCKELGKHLLSAVTFTPVQQFHMVVGQRQRKPQTYWRNLRLEKVMLGGGGEASSMGFIIS